MRTFTHVLLAKSILKVSQMIPNAAKNPITLYNCIILYNIMFAMVGFWAIICSYERLQQYKNV